MKIMSRIQNIFMCQIISEHIEITAEKRLKVMSLERTVQDTLATVERLPSSIMRSAFNGEV